jgi:hypothetical protein
LTKTRRPSAATSRAATPGEKPPGWVVAETTGLPSQPSTSERTGSGNASHAIR